MLVELEKKRDGYTFWHETSEKPSIILGCPWQVDLCAEDTTCRLHVEWGAALQHAF